MSAPEDVRLPGTWKGKTEPVKIAGPERPSYNLWITKANDLLAEHEADSYSTTSGQGVASED